MPESFEVIGHRGNGAGPDENSWPSFQASLRNGADRLETDVQLIKGKLWLVHPHGRAWMTLAALLEKTDAPLVLHLKRRRLNPWHDYYAIKELVPLVTGRANVTVSSFWPGTLRFLKRHHPKVRTAFITFWPAYDLLLSHSVGAAEYHGWWRLCTERAIRRAAARKVRLIAFVAPPTEEARRKLRVPGIRGVITDHIPFFTQPRRAARQPRPRSVRGSGRA